MLGKQDNFLTDFNWKLILKDIGRFFAYQILLFVLSLLMIAGLGQILFELYDMRMNEWYSDFFSTNETQPMLDFESYMSVVERTGLYIFSLACLALFFFARPLRTFKHALCIFALLFLVLNLLLVFETFEQFFYFNACLFISMLAGWLCAFLLYRAKTMPENS